MLFPFLLFLVSFRFSFVFLVVSAITNRFSLQLENGFVASVVPATDPVSCMLLCQKSV